MTSNLAYQISDSDVNLRGTSLLPLSYASACTGSKAPTSGFSRTSIDEGEARPLKSASSFDNIPGLTPNSCTQSKSCLYDHPRHPKKLAVPSIALNPAVRISKKQQLRDTITPQHKTGAACDKCRARKSKCTGEKPCRRCADRGLDCTYVEPKARGTLRHREFLRQEAAFQVRQEAVQAKLERNEYPAIPFPLVPPHLVAFDPKARAIYSGRPISSRSPLKEPRQKPHYLPCTPPRKLKSTASSCESTPQYSRTPLFLPSRVVSPVQEVDTDVLMTAADDSSVVTATNIDSICASMQLPRAPYSEPPSSLQDFAVDADWSQFTNLAAYDDDNSLYTNSASSASAPETPPVFMHHVTGERSDGFFKEMFDDKLCPPMTSSMTSTFRSLHL